MRIARASVQTPPRGVWRAVSSHKSTPGRAPNDVNCNNNSRQGVVIRYAPQDTAIAFPRFAVPAWLVFNTNAGAEVDDPYTWQVTYSLEYPVGGRIYPITWRGNRTLTLTPGARSFWSDPVPVVIQPADPYKIRDWGQALDLRPPVATVTVTGGVLASTAITDPGMGLNTTKPVFASASAPALSAAVPTGAGAGSGGAIACTVVNGMLTALPLTGGAGYTDGTYPIVFANGANMCRSSVRSTGDGANHGTGLADLTLSGGAVAQDQLGQMAPMLIIGRQSVPRPAIGLIMDSILDGTSDQQDFPSGHTGAFEKSITNRHGWVAIGCSGETLASYLKRGSATQAMLRGAITHLVCGLLRNDVGVGATLASLQAQLEAVWLPFLMAGIKVYQVTCLPTTTSTDNWATTTNQTPSAFEALRVSINGWLRATAPGLFGITIIDMCSVVESSIDSGLFKAPGAGSSAIPRPIFNGSGVCTSCTIQSGINYAASATIHLEVFYPEGCPGSGLAIDANTDGSGNITSTTIVAGGTGHVAANPPMIGVPGVGTIDGVHPSTYLHYKMTAAGLFAPSQFVL